MTMADDKRFEFGKNWASFSQGIGAEQVAEAVRRLQGLIAPSSLAGKSVLDIGCGSGLHSVAALELGAGRIHAVDLDPHSVATTRTVLERLGGTAAYTVEQKSVFDLSPEQDGLFDVVYSWGVLHHTGNMDEAIRKASAMVRPGGLLVIALYGKTPYCGMWTRIKRWYVSADATGKARAERAYVGLFGVYLLLRGKRLSTHIRNYPKKRGMDFYHDVRDWIGGYPYESITSAALQRLILPLGFALRKEKVKRRSGLFGSGCDEYVFARNG